MIAYDWPDSVVARMSDLVADGKTAENVSIILSEETGAKITRNMVIGKCRRSRVALLNPIGQAIRRKQAAEKEKIGTPKPPRVCAKSPAISPAPVEMLPFDDNVPEERRGAGQAISALRLGACRWPAGNPFDRTFYFCMGDSGEETYCPTHRALSVRPRIAP